MWTTRIASWTCMTYVDTRVHGHHIGHREGKVFGVRFVSIISITFWISWKSIAFELIPKLIEIFIIFLQMFNANELLVLEYAKDLNSFSETGPSCDLNKIVQCPSVRDMMEQLSRSRGPKVTAYFTHSPAILLHLTAMGAYAQGEPIKAKYNKRTQYREWNTSTLSPMAANFVAVLYKNNKVKFFLNDKVVYLPFDDCPNGLCDVIFLRSLYGHCM